MNFGKITSRLQIFVMAVWSILVGLPLCSFFVQCSSVGLSFIFDPVVLSTVRMTVIQSALSVFISVLFGLPIGLWTGKHLSLIPKSLSRLLLVFPTTLPIVIVVYSWTHWVPGYYGLWPVIILHSFLNAPWIAWQIAECRSRIPLEQIEAAQELGASRVSGFIYLVWPQIRGTLGAGVLQSWIACCTSFTIILLLGGGPPMESLETLIYQSLRYGDSSKVDQELAFACAFWQLLLTCVPWCAGLKMGNGFRKKQLQLTAYPRFSLRWSLQDVVLLLILTSSIVPYLGAFLNKRVLRFSADPESWLQLLGPVFVSLSYAALTTAGTLIWASAAAVSNLQGWREGLVLLPRAVSFIVLALGMGSIYGGSIDLLRFAPFYIVGLQMVLFFPLAYVAMSQLRLASSNNEMEEAISLGATPVEAFFYTQWPRVKKSIISLGAVVFAGAFGEVGIVTLFYSDRYLPLSSLISQSMLQYRFEEAEALLALLLLVYAGVLAISFAIGNGNSKRYAEI